MTDVPDLDVLYPGGTILPKGRKKKVPVPVSTICGCCGRFSSDHSIREKRGCAQGIDDRAEP